MKFSKLTPNLFVRDVEASMKFYQSVLGFQRAMTVPDTAPYIFGAVKFGAIAGIAGWPMLLSDAGTAGRPS